MNLLFLTPAPPLPADQGAKLRARALVAAAAQHHRVDLLSFRLPDRPADMDGLRALCANIRLVDAPPPRSRLARAWSLLIGVDPLPDLARRFWSAEFSDALGELLARGRYDVVQIEGLELMGYAPMVRAWSPAARLVYDAHNAEAALQRTMVRAEATDPRRWHAMLYSLVQWSRLTSYERLMVGTADLVLAVSEEDAAQLRGRRCEPRVVPNGVDLTALPFCPAPADPVPSILFVGPLDYRPNADAVRWLLSRVLPRVRRQVPAARLRLVGRGTEQVQAEGVEGMGYVADASVELQRAAVLVVPMRMGSGVRFKVLEAMASGVPVVSTPLGVAGIAAESGRHALVGRSSAELAEAVVQVLRDRRLAQSLASAARALVERQYTWSRITPAYLRTLREITRGRR